MHNLNEEIGTRISAQRKKHKITQEVLAEKLDISIKHCSSVERGLASLSLERLMDCCDIFDISLDFLVRGETPGRTQRVPATVVEFYKNSTPEEQELMEQYLLLFQKIKELNKK